MNAPKGFLIALQDSNHLVQPPYGKAENSFDPFYLGALETIIEMMPAARPAIELITTTTFSSHIIRFYKEAFKKLGCARVHHMSIPDRQAADEPANLWRIERCGGVLLIADDALRLCSVLGGTTLVQVLQRRYLASPFVLGGINAGAAALGSYIINERSGGTSLLKGSLKFSVGLGFISNVIIDTGFDAYRQLVRMAPVIAEQPGKVCIGLTEGTGIVVVNGNWLNKVGRGNVMVLDGSKVSNNIADIEMGAPVSLTNLLVHLLGEGDTYDLQLREFSRQHSKHFVEHHTN